jgi:hypothetical protein
MDRPVYSAAAEQRLVRDGDDGVHVLDGDVSWYDLDSDHGPNMSLEPDQKKAHTPMADRPRPALEPRPATAASPTGQAESLAWLPGRAWYH